jgi:hypothetical protein
MLRRNNHPELPEEGAHRVPQNGPLPDLPLYERLIGDGIVTANNRGTSVDHLTARRLAIWLAARPQAPAFARGLVEFTKTGAISSELRAHLRIHARSGNYADQAQAARFLQYCVARGPSVAPISENFGTACDQLDRADVMLTGLYDRSRQGQTHPEPARPDEVGARPVALAARNPERQTVSFVLDATTADAIMFAIAANAAEREAHIREVERYGRTLPEGSYGRRNRDAIAARETRIAGRLRAVEHAYRMAIERDAAIRPPEAAGSHQSSQRTADREIEME